MYPIRAFLIAFIAASALSAQSNFPAEDRNGDGIVTRDEWTGNNRSFRNQDVNNDGMLSGNELPRGWSRSNGYLSRGTEPQRRSDFTRWDRNRDEAIQRSEWRGDMATFRRLDGDRDGRLTWYEYSGNSETGTRSRTAEMDRNASGAVEGYEWPYNRELFHQLDRNGDSVLTSDELRNMDRMARGQSGGFANFRDLDANGDGRISTNEYYDRGGAWQRRQRFQGLDKNGDGIIQSTEWQTSSDLFHRLDANGNSQVEWEEFQADANRYMTPRRR